MLKVREDQILLREWSDGTAQLRALGETLVKGYVLWQQKVVMEPEGQANFLIRSYGRGLEIYWNYGPQALVDVAAASAAKTSAREWPCCQWRNSTFEPGRGNFAEWHPLNQKKTWETIVDQNVGRYTKTRKHRKTLRKSQQLTVYTKKLNLPFPAFKTYAGFRSFKLENLRNPTRIRLDKTSCDQWFAAKQD